MRMEKAEKARESIIGAATALIADGKGDIEGITVRAIAEKAGVGVGLVNYHFQTKENLVEICVQRMVSDVISAFRPDGGQSVGMGRLVDTAVQVFDFLFENPSVSRISILGDLSSPGENDNTAKTVMGFESAMPVSGPTDAEKRTLSFALTSAMQCAFLRRGECRALLGCDLNIKEERAVFIRRLIGALYGGTGR